MSSVPALPPLDHGNGCVSAQQGSDSELDGEQEKPDGEPTVACSTLAPPPPPESGIGSEVGNAQAKPLNKFKVTARMVTKNMVLTRGLAQDAEKHLKMYTVPSADGKASEMFTFNVQSYFPECQSCSGLSARVKMILMKVAWSRTEEELEIVRRFVIKLACFSRYSLYVRHELAHVLFYDVFERGRVVIRQGDVGYSFYFIVSGSVLVEIQDKDPISGIVRNNIVGELGAGATFGDLALLNDDKRRATIVCKEDCEFLKVDKTDFNRILMESCKDTWTRTNAILSQHPLFQDWSQDSLKLAIEGSQFVEYSSNSVIIKNLSEQLDHVFIVTKGKCKVVQKVTLLMSRGALRKGRKVRSPQLILPPITTDRTVLKHTDLQKPCNESASRDGHSKRQRVKKWWVIRTLYPGDYFGLGEGPSDTCVICADMAECLLINTTILAKQSQGRYLEEVRNEAKKLYPSIEIAFQSYVEGKEWMEYKQSVLQEVISDLKRQRRS